jgi:hypothetical protein
MEALKLAPNKDEVDKMQKEKRKNFMHEIRGALINGEENETEAKVITKKKKKVTKE